MDELPVDCTTFNRMICCGKGMHKHCAERVKRSKMSEALKDRCPECRQNFPTTHEEAVKQVRVWVDKGKAWAQSNLASKYKYGAGVPQSYEDAVKYYNMAVEQGNPNAMFALAILYDHGHGVAQSYQKAADLYALAANQRHGGALFNLGNAYYSGGKGVAQSYSKAIELYTLAAKQGVANAQDNLGIIYYQGKLVAQSNDMAREWWLKAALEGHKGAIQHLQTLDQQEGKTTPTLPCCAACGTHETTRCPLKSCNRCHTAQYCNRDCQMTHWKDGHKRECTRLLKEHEKKQAAAGGEK
jgi:TPR repeat protein